MSAIAVLVIVAGGAGLWAYSSSRACQESDVRYAPVLRGIESRLGGSDWKVSSQQLTASRLRAQYAAVHPTPRDEVVRGVVRAQAITARNRGGEVLVWFAQMKSPDLAAKLISLDYKAIGSNLEQMEITHGTEVLARPVSAPVRGIDGDMVTKVTYRVAMDDKKTTTTHAFVSRGDTVVGVTFSGTGLSDAKIASIAEEVFQRLRAVPKSNEL